MGDHREILRPLTTLSAQHLPVELVREVFELAANQSLAIASSLVRISKTVREWIIPLLYQTVVLQSTSSVLSFYETIEVEKSQFASHVKSLYLPGAPCPGVPTNFLAHFPALQHLAISSLSLRHSIQPSLSLSPFPRPTSITIMGPLGRVSFEHPIFHHCTHLYLANDVPAPYTLTTAKLPCLTHLSCAYRHGSGSTTAVTCLPLLLAQGTNDYTDPSRSSSAPAMSPVQLKVLVVELYLADGHSDATMFVMERLGLGKKSSEWAIRADPRLVLIPGEALTPWRWENCVINDILWSNAEREIKIQSVLKTRT